MGLRHASIKLEIRRDAVPFPIGVTRGLWTFWAIDLFRQVDWLDREAPGVCFCTGALTRLTNASQNLFIAGVLDRHMDNFTSESAPLTGASQPTSWS
jgi:hypothetical protein